MRFVRLKNLAFQAFVICMLTLANAVTAQVAAELVIDPDHFLAGETIKAAVKVTNFSGRTLKLGTNQEWLTFNVEGQSSQIVNRIGEVPVIMPFDLENSHVATRRVDIAPYFELNKTGRYKVTAVVSLPSLGKQIATRPAYFAIVSGTKIWEQVFGLNRPGSGSESRKYVLLQITQKNVRRLYVRVADPEELRSFKTFPIGNLVSFGLPEHQIDGTGRLHVLSQYSARSFNYCVVDPDGELVIRQTYEQEGGFRPSLVMADDGQIIVKGGNRRKTEADLPEPTQTSNTPAPEAREAKP